MRNPNRKPSLFRSWILLALALLVCIGAAGATWAILREVADQPVVNSFNEAVEYRLSYDVNGGSGSIADNVYIGAVGETSHTFTVTAEEPTLENYLFLGWADSADAEAAAYTAGASITLTKNAPTKTVYAVWEEIYVEDPNDFRLEFDANVPEGVTASVMVPGAVEKTAGADLYTFQIANALATDLNVDNTGLRFLGWSTSEFGDVIYACDAANPAISVTVAPGTTTLYAVWGFDYYITFDRNASDGSVVKYQQGNSAYQDDQKAITVKLEHDTVSVSGAYTDSGYGYRREAHMLVGFASTAGGTQPLQSVTIPKAGKNNALIVYSIWEDGSFALVYDANGGKSAPAADIVITTATSHTFTVTSQKPVKADNAEATFLGWAADPDATAPDAAYAAGKTITLTEANPTMTLYAVWEYTYRLNFDRGHATEGDVPGEIVVGPTTDKSVTITVPKDPTPTRDQYEFDYWAASEERISGEHRYFDAANYSRVITLYADDTNVTMYARMKPTDGVTLNYSANGGSGGPGYQKANDNTQDFCSFTIPSTQPTRANYTFLGWAESASATAPTLFAGDVVKIDGDVQASKTIYAVWKRYDRMRVYVSYNGGSATSGSGCNATTVTSATGSYEYINPGATVYSFDAVSLDPFPSRSGYSLAGFAYQVTDGSLRSDIGVSESICNDKSVTGIKWQQSLQTNGTQTVRVISTNADGSRDLQLTVYMIWAKNAAKDRYIVKLNKNHSNSSGSTVSEEQLVNQVKTEQSGSQAPVVNTSYTFATSRFSLSSLANSRTGYKLLGFARTTDATSPGWSVSGSTLQNSITVSQNDPDVVFVNGGGSDGGSSYTLNLYAVWERQQFYKVFADFGIGSYSIYNDSSNSYVTYNDYTWQSQQPLSVTSHTFTAPTMNGTPDITGFKFLGFSTDPNATTPEYTVSGNTLSPAITVSQDDPNVVKSTSADNVDTWTLNLHAIYEKLQLFRLSLDFNGGTYSGSSTRATVVEQPLSVDTYTWGSTVRPSRTGYKFLGYATTPDATEPEYTLTSSNTLSPNLIYDTNVLTPTINTDDVKVYTQTLYAVWEEQRQFIVQVDANGGSYATDATKKATKTTDTDVPEVTWDAGTLSIATPTKTNFRFLGYAYSPDATVPDFTVSGGKIVEAVTVSETGDYVVNDTSAIPNTSTLTLYAVWEPLKYYQVRFDLGEGSYTDSSSSLKSEIVLTSSAQSITSNTFTFSSPSYTARSSPSLTGQYLYGYTEDEDWYETQDLPTITLPRPTSSGSSAPYTYKFNNTSIVVTEGAEGVTTEVMDNGVTYVTKTFYPVWGIELDYRNGNDLPGTAIRYYPASENRVMDISSKVPTNKNFLFAGWTTSTGSMTPEYGISGTYVGESYENPLSETYTMGAGSNMGYLYAVWWQRYTISFSANGGLENTTPGRDSGYATLNYSSSSTSYTFEIGNNVPVYDSSNSRPFLGWSTDPNATEGTYMPGEDIEVSGKTDGSETETVLYAIWGEPTAQAAEEPSEPAANDVTEPTVADVSKSIPEETTEPTATDPTEPIVVSVTEPTVASYKQPLATDTVVPAAADPVDPEPADPAPAEPVAVDPVDPESTDLAPADPVEPATVDPVDTVPTDPAPTVPDMDGGSGETSPPEGGFDG